MTFKYIYALPLIHDEYDSSIVWTTYDDRAFDFAIDEQGCSKISDTNMKFIISVINGTMKLADLQKNSGHRFDLYHQGGTIFHNNLLSKEFIHIRGLGRMEGGLNLSQKLAHKIQDDFAQFIIDRLTQE